MVSVGLRAPWVHITDPPKMPRFGTSCEKPHLSTTLVSGLPPMRVPPTACHDRLGPSEGAGTLTTSIAPAARNHSSALAAANALAFGSFSFGPLVIRHTGFPRGSFISGSRSMYVLSYESDVHCAYAPLQRPAF